MRVRIPTTKSPATAALPLTRDYEAKVEGRGACHLMHLVAQAAQLAFTVDPRGRRAEHHLRNPSLVAAFRSKERKRSKENCRPRRDGEETGRVREGRARIERGSRQERLILRLLRRSRSLLVGEERLSAWQTGGPTVVRPHLE